MRTLLSSALVTLLAFLILRKLSPGLFERRAVTRGFWALAVALHLLVAAEWLLGGHEASLIGAVARASAGSWVVAMFICILAGGPWLLGRSLLKRFGRAEPLPVDLSRRRLFEGMAVPVAAISTGAGGTLAGLRPFQIRHERIALKDLPPALDGFRIGQLTDVHVGDFIDPEYLEAAVEALDREGVDLQVMTGDLIDDLTQLEPTIAALNRTRARHGMLAILGNHEKWRDEEAVVAAYERVKPNGRLRLLIDESVTLDHNGASVRVVGVDYPMKKGGRHRLPKAERQALMQASAARAFAGSGPDDFLLCLTHHPDFFPIAAERKARLSLAGHTHGGQVGLFGIPLFGFAFEHMLGRYKRGDSHLYVSGGTGHWLPFRVGVPTEVTVLTLRRA